MFARYDQVTSFWRATDNAYIAAFAGESCQVEFMLGYGEAVNEELRALPRQLREL